MIKHLTHQSIDKALWDKCISLSGVRVPYALSWYLDIVSPHWNALVLGDYEAVMPLTYRSKFGIKYIYQPSVCQQLGVFSSVKDEHLADSFISALPKMYRLIETNLHAGIQPAHGTGMETQQRTNQFLKLALPYQNIFEGYSKNHKSNIAKALEKGVEIVKGHISFEQFFNDIMQNYQTLGIKLPHHKRVTHFNIFKHLGSAGSMVIYTALQNGQVLGSACFVSFNGWATLNSYTTPLGKKLFAGFLLIDAFIHDWAETNITLDFMGSSIPGIAYRNKGFGCAEEQYHTLRMNRLPWPVRWLR